MAPPDSETFMVQELFVTKKVFYQVASWKTLL